jgi:type I restriction enzyme, S subunit
MASERLPAALDTRPRRFRPYPEYKDSGVDWLGAIPAHWQVRRLKTLARALLSNVDKKSVEGHIPVQLCNYVDVYYHDHITRAIDFMPATATPEQRAKFSIRRGDVLITKDSESWTDIAVPAVVAEDLDDVVCGYHLAHIRPFAEMDGRFLARAFSAVGSRDQFQIAANGITRFGLSGDAIKTALFAVPPPAEQIAIASFLDRETAKIDALVAKKQRVIELLQERRAALITQTVTKGLDPTAHMKDSGVEWLGQIPTHWSVKRLKYLVPDVTVGIVVTPAKYYVDDGIPCLRSLNISSGTIDMDSLVFISKEANDYHRKSQIFEDDVVVVRTGQAGTAAVVPKELNGANCIDLLIVRRSSQLRPKMVYYYLNSRAAISQAEVRSVGAIQGHYNTSTLAELFVPVIPLEEQDRIVRHLDDQTASMDGLMRTVRDGIDRLHEFRAALIAAAVTGRIDVREEAA